MPNTNRIKTSEIETLQEWASLGTLPKDTLETALRAINKRNTFSCQLLPQEASAQVNIGTVEITLEDGRKMRPSPLRSLLPEFNGGFIDTLTGMYSANVTPFVFPEAPDSDSYVRMGLSLTNDGFIVVTFNTIAPTVGGVDTLSFPRGSIALGYLDLRSTGGAFPTTQWKGAFSATDIIESNSITQFLGAGGGSGGGDANELLERLKNRHLLSNWNYLYAGVFEVIGDEDIDPFSTTTFNTEGFVEFPNVGDTLLTTNLLSESDFLSKPTNLRTLEVITYWGAGFFDPDAIYEISRNGGGDWTAFSAERIGQSDAAYSTISLSPADTDAVLVPSSTPDSVAPLVASLSGAFSIEEKSLVRKITLGVSIEGSPVGLVSLKVVKDDGGVPSSAPQDFLGRSFYVDTASIFPGDLVFSFAGIVLVPGEYHIVLEATTFYQDQYALSSGADRIDLPTLAGNLDSEIEGILFDLRLRITGQTEDARLAGFGVLYEPLDMGTNLQGVVLKDKKTFIGDVDNENEFTINFRPDKNKLVVFESGTGRAYFYGSFSLNGHTVIFEPNTFNISGTVNLVFIQFTGGSTDNSDFNGSLLAANHLGSSDPTIDASIPGRGIFLRRPDGLLREICLNDNDDLEIYTV